MAEAFCCILLSFLVGNARCRETKFTRNPKNCICCYGINWDLSTLTIKPSASNVWSNLQYFLLWMMHDQYVILLYNQTNTHLFQPAHNCFFITVNICGADVNPNGRHTNCILFAFIGDIDILCEWRPGDMHPLGPSPVHLLVEDMEPFHLKCSNFTKLLSLLMLTTSLCPLSFFSTKPIWDTLLLVDSWASLG